MSEHKIPLDKRRALGLVGIRPTPRGADKEQRKAVNRALRHVMGRFRAMFPRKPTAAELKQREQAAIDALRSVTP